MGSASLNALLRLLTNLSGVDALILGFLVLCAVCGAVVAIYVGLRAFIDARRNRRTRRGTHT